MPLLCGFALATGIRQDEIWRLQVEDVDRAAKTVVIRDRKDPSNKAGNHQTVPLLPDAWAIVEPLLGDRTEGQLFLGVQACPLPSRARAQRSERPVCRRPGGAGPGGAEAAAPHQWQQHRQHQGVCDCNL
jgi:integrase